MGEPIPVEPLAAPPIVSPGNDDSVACAYVHSYTVHYSWHRSLVDLMAYDLQSKQRLARGSMIASPGGTDGLAAARNSAVKMFLKGDASWLWWIDTDMGFQPDTLDRLVEVADPAERPVVGGLCFSQHIEGEDGFGGVRWTAVPTVYDWMTTETGKKGWIPRMDFRPDQLIRVGGTGGACILIHRGVFEKIEAEHGPVWYDRVTNPTMDNSLISEDLSFSLRVQALGIPMFVHTGVETTHAKLSWIGAETFWEQRTLDSIREARFEVKAP